MKNYSSSPVDMAAEPKIAEPKIKSTDSSTLSNLPQQPRSNWLKRKLNSLSIRQQIYLGYTVTMAIAILGTTTGLLIGYQYQKQAYDGLTLANNQEKLLSDLHAVPLEIPFYHQNLLKNRPNQTAEEFEAEQSLWLARIRRFQEELLELESADDRLPELATIFDRYSGAIDAYALELGVLLEQIDPLGVTPKDRETARKLLWEFSEKPAVQQFNQFSEELQKIIPKVHERKLLSSQDFSQATRVRQQIIVSSLLVSVLLSTGLAIYTSRAIARPLEQVTQVAQRVTNESNFNLQIPVIKHDEIGSIAISINQLIASVKQLLNRLEQEKETQLLQSEKMASLGRMLAGVAHELNNPINFIYGNIAPAKEYIEDIFDLLETYAVEIPHPPEAVVELTESIELDFVQEDLIKIIQSMQLGAERARSIVLSLKNFSRLDDDVANPVNLHDCIDSTLIMLHNRIKKGITVVTNYGEIPEIEGYMGLLYQVFMNLLSNAIDALEEKGESSQTPQITITTEIFESEYVRVRIADNGLGIKLNTQEKIFETFFTTKPRGVGTGLGLAISRQIVSEKHGGKLSCHSEVGQGTEFLMVLPIKHQTI